MLGDDADLDAAQRWVDEWQSGIAERAERATALSGRLAALSATARSPDGLIEVTVAASGTVTALRLDERIRQQSAARTATQVVATIGAAQRELTRLATEATAETVGLDNETGQAIVRSFAARLADPPRDGADGR